MVLFQLFLWLFLRCTWKKITTRVRNCFITIWFKNYLNFNFSVSHFFKFINFKITTNSFIYSLVEPFLETHFHKNNYRGKGVYFWKKLTKIFGFIYPLTWGNGVYYTNNNRINNYVYVWSSFEIISSLILLLFSKLLLIIMIC